MSDLRMMYGAPAFLENMDPKEWHRQLERLRNSAPVSRDEFQAAIASIEARLALLTAAWRDIAVSPEPKRSKRRKAVRR